MSALLRVGKVKRWVDVRERIHQVNRVIITDLSTRYTEDVHIM